MKKFLITEKQLSNELVDAFKKGKSDSEPSVIGYYVNSRLEHLKKSLDVVEDKWVLVSDELPPQGLEVYLWDGNYISEGHLMKKRDVDELYGDELINSTEGNYWDNVNWFGFVKNKFTHWRKKPIITPPK